MASVEPEKTDTQAPEIATLPVANHRIREIAGIVLVASSILAFISLFSDGVGVIGTLLSHGLRWFAGRASYLVPALVFMAGLLVFRGHWQVPVLRRCLGVLLFFLVALVILHLVHLWPHFPPVWKVRDQALLGMQGLGGGAAGGVLAAALMQAFGLPGAVVLSVSLTLIATVLTFDVSFYRLVLGLVRSTLGIGGRCLRWTGRALWFLLEESVHGVRRMRERRERQQLQRWGLIPERTGVRGVSSVEAARHADGEAFHQRAVHQARARYDEPGADGVHITESAQRPSGSGVLPVGSRWLQWQERSEGSDQVSRGLSHAGALPEESGPGEGEPVAGGGQDGASGQAAPRRSALVTLADTDAEGRLRMPPTSLLELPRRLRRPGRLVPDEPDLSSRLEETLASFGVEAKVVHVSRGPVITRYEVQPRPGIKVSRIVSLADDIALALAAAGVRIEAPVPGKSVVGIEVPNQQVTPVYLREVLESEAFIQSTSPLTVGLGKDIAGQPVVADLKKLLHLLIAGATGSGKSVCLNAIIISLLYKARPCEVKFIMIDPKRVELAVYDGIPHLIAPVVTDPRKAAGVLRWVVKEMERRYQLCSEVGVRNVDGYNALMRRQGRPDSEVLPYLVVIIDELADLMLVAAADVEDSICRLAQMARAAGIYLIIATQRPSVDVITGLIKANVPSRIAFAVSSQVDSRTILDMAGAERLLGKGDMLFHPIGSGKPQRVQGAFIEDREVEDVVAYWKSQQEPQYQEEVLQEQETSTSDAGEVDDELFEDAVRLVMEQGQASVSMIQRRFRVGYARAARLIDMMEQRGIVGPYQGSKPREVLRTYPSNDE